MAPAGSTLLAALALAAAICPAAAEDETPRRDWGRFMVIEENDSIYTNDDRYYTQGFQWNYLSPTVEPESVFNAPFHWMSGSGGAWDWAAPFSGAGASHRRYEILFGQSIFTAHDISIANPSSGDRPYAGWLYMGIGMDQDTDHRRLDHLELTGGVVGPHAYGRMVQNDWHQFMGIGQAKGWDHQLDDEPGFMLSYERKWRFYQPLFFGQEVDAIPELGATVGNVMTYGAAGLTLRFGQNLRADYGQARIRPSSSGTGYFDQSIMEGPFGYYFYVSAQGRAVGRNIFLDGNTFGDSRSVDKKPLVGDLSAGIALFWSDYFRLDGSATYRTKEFDGQPGDDVILAGFNVSIGL